MPFNFEIAFFVCHTFNHPSFSFLPHFGNLTTGHVPSPHAGARRYRDAAAAEDGLETRGRPGKKQRGGHPANHAGRQNGSERYIK